MPPGKLLRPAALGLVLFCAFLSWKRAKAPFCPPPDRALYAMRRGALLSVGLDQPAREDARGLWMEGELQGYRGQRVRVRWKEVGLLDSPLPGATIEALCGLRRPRPARNPGDYDERRHLEDRGVQWLAECGPPRVVKEARGPRAWAGRLRLRLERRWREALSPLGARLMAGLVLGYKGPLERELNREAQDAGVIHLLVPSGAKVAAVVLAVEGLCAFLRAPPWLRFFCVFSCGGFFTLVVGGEPPYVRAWLSASLARVGAALERDAAGFTCALLSAWLQLLWDPAALFTMGFQMSWACAFVLSAYSGRRPARIRGHLTVTALVEAALWPIFASGFGRAAVLGALANLLLVPLSLPLIAAGWGLAAVDAPPLAWAAARGLDFFRRACGFFAGLPGAAVDLEPMTAAATFGFYVCLSALLLRLRPAARGALLAAGLSFPLGERIWLYHTAPELSVLYLSQPGFRAAALVRRRLKPPVLVTLGRAEAALRRAARARGWGEPAEVVSLRERPGWGACQGRVCFRFDQPCFHGPSGEFCILALLKKHAVEASTDGSTVQLRQASDQLRRRLL